MPFRLLGEGSQAQTFEAVDRKDGRAVAIKRFDVSGATSWKDVELAEREAKILSTLCHPSVPAYVHHFEENGALYLVTEKVEGQDLAERLRTGQRFSFEELQILVETMADVFDYLHGRSPPIVHRDIKPSNIVQRSAGGYSLIDFGSVRAGLLPEGGSTVVGTFGYMAPEQFQGRALPASDLYGTGVTLITLLTGIPPDRLPHRGLEIDVRRALPASTPRAWTELLECVLRVDPDRRAVDLKSFLPALRAPAQPGPTAAATSTDPDPKPEHPSDPAEVLHQHQSELLIGAGTTLPFILILVLSLLRVILYLMLQIALPLVLTVLSGFFGKRLREIAADVTQAGRVANQQLLAAIEHLAQRGPLVVRRRHRFGPGHRLRPTDHNAAWHPNARPRHMRVGNFDVELPPESESDAAARSAANPKRRN